MRASGAISGDHMRKTTNEHNENIDFFRLISCILIALLHFESAMYPEKNFFSGGYLAVDFFFIVSGFYLYKNYSVRQEMPIVYMHNRVKKLYPMYFVGCILAIFYSLLEMLKAHKTIADILLFFIKEIPEILCLQMFGITNQWVNFPLWYVSALLLSSIILYSIIYVDK